MLNILAINTEDLLQSLGILWKGLLAIAIVIGAIILVTAIVSKIDESITKKEAQKEAEKNNTDTSV